MCWNAAVSLNTFIFSTFVLLLIYYNNTYTKYKIKEFDTIWVYLFFMSFISMQLIEYFIWTYIKNPSLNNLFTHVAALLLFFQPFASLMLLDNTGLRNKMMAAYLLFNIPVVMYSTYLGSKFSSIVSPKGHLVWSIFPFDKYNVYFFVWQFFFLFSFFYNSLFVKNKPQYKFGLLFGFSLLLWAMYQYYRDKKSVGSVWCWIINSIMIYYAAVLLIVLPFKMG